MPDHWKIESTIGVSADAQDHIWISNGRLQRHVWIGGNGQKDGRVLHAGVLTSFSDAGCQRRPGVFFGVEHRRGFVRRGSLHNGDVRGKPYCGCLQSFVTGRDVDDAENDAADLRRFARGVFEPAADVRVVLQAHHQASPHQRGENRVAVGFIQPADFARRSPGRRASWRAKAPAAFPDRHRAPSRFSFPVFAKGARCMPPGHHAVAATYAGCASAKITL